MGSVRPPPPCAECGQTSFERGRLTSPDGLYIVPTGDGAGWGAKLGAMFKKKNAVDVIICVECGRIALYAADRAPRI